MKIIKLFLLFLFPLLSFAQNDCSTEIYIFPTAAQRTFIFNGNPINDSYYYHNIVWFFGDGDSSNLKAPIHTYLSTGNYKVTLRTYDNTCFSETFDSIIVKDSLTNIAISICQNGLWSDPCTWLYGKVPLPTDSVLIYSTVILDIDVTLTCPGLLYIDKQGSLCGHKKFEGGIIIFGTMNVDYLTVNSPCLFSYTDFTSINILYIWEIITPEETQYFPLCNNFTCSNNVGCCENIQTMQQEHFLKIYPNPVIDKLFFNLLQKAEIEISNIEGQIIKRINTTEKQSTIDISDLARGMYFIKVTTEKETITKKFIKE